MSVLNGRTRGITGTVGTLFYLLFLVLLSAVLAQSIVFRPNQVSIVVGGGMAVVLLAVAAYKWPHRTLQFCFLLALFGNTKYRRRSTVSLLRETTADAQIAWELSVSAALAMVTVIVAFRVLRRIRMTTFEAILLVFGLFALLSATWSPVPQMITASGIASAPLSRRDGILCTLLDREWTPSASWSQAGGTRPGSFSSQRSRGARRCP